MKKISALFIILSLNLVSCQEREFPKLEDKKILNYFDDPEYFESQYANKETGDYFSFYKGVYEFTTTKNSSLKSKKDIETTSFPWKYKVTNLEAKKLLENIADSIYARKDGYASYKNSPTSEIIIVSKNVLRFTNRETEELESKRSLKTTPNILDYINYKYLDYNLTNEKGDIVTIEQEYLGICGQGMSKKGESYYHGFCMQNNSLKPKYEKLFGTIEIEVQIPIDYEIKKITNKNIGETFYIGANKIKILEFDGNSFHYQIIKKGEDFETLLSANNSSELILSLDYYKKLRQNQGLNFEEVVENKELFELDKERSSYKEEIFISNLDDYFLDFVYFYIPKYVSKKIKIPINIEN